MLMVLVAWSIDWFGGGPSTLGILSVALLSPIACMFEITLPGHAAEELTIATDRVDALIIEYSVDSD